MVIYQVILRIISKAILNYRDPNTKSHISSSCVAGIVLSLLRVTVSRMRLQGAHACPCLFVFARVFACVCIIRPAELPN